jgi:hypothetical protein
MINHTYSGSNILTFLLLVQLPTLPINTNFIQINCMQKIIILVIATVMAVSTMAQQKEINTDTVWVNKEFKPTMKLSEKDIAILKKHFNIGQNAPVYKMPNAIKSNQYTGKQQQQGNNGNGFDIYIDALDGMAVAKPDSSNKAMLTMPSTNQKLLNAPEKKPNTPLQLAPKQQEPKK